MNLTKLLSGCAVDQNSKWARYAAAAMGGSFFLRMVYYFGLVNLKDVGGGALFAGLILPALTAAVFVLAIKLPKLNHPAVFPALSVIVAVNYFFTATGTGAIVSGVLQLLCVGLYLALCLGKLPKPELLPIASLAVLAVRVVFADLLGFLLPLAQFRLVPYVLQCADLCALASLSLLYLTVKAVAAAAPAESK